MQVTHFRLGDICTQILFLINQHDLKFKTFRDSRPLSRFEITFLPHYSAVKSKFY